MAPRTALTTTILLGNWLIASSAWAQPAYMDAGVFYLKNYVTADAANCDQNTKPDGSGEFYHCDLKQAFRTALEKCADSKDKYGLDRRMGCVFVVPEGKHRLTETVNLCRSHVIMGESGWRLANGTQIDATDTAFAMLSVGECGARNIAHTAPPTLDRGTGGYPVIKGLQINGPGQRGNGAPATFGILMNVAGRVENVSVSNFVQGIRILGGSGSVNNANGFVLRDVLVGESEHAGIFVDGSDANGGLGELIDVTGNCKRADYWKTQSTLLPSIDGAVSPSTCSGLWDSSQLGNTWIAVTNEYTEDTSTGTDFPATLFDPASALQSGMCLGCYLEGPVLSPMAPLSAAIGLSSNHWDGNGWVLHGPSTNKLAIGNTRNPDYHLNVEIGFEENTFIKLVRTDNHGLDFAAPFRIRYAPANSSYQMDVQGPSEVEPAHSLSFIGYGSIATPSMQGLPTGSLYIKDWLRAERVQVINKIHAAQERYTVVELGGENEDNPSFLRMWYSNVPSGGTLASSPLVLEYNPVSQNYQFQVSELVSLMWRGAGTESIGRLFLDPALMGNFCSVADSCHP